MDKHAFEQQYENAYNHLLNKNPEMFKKAFEDAVGDYVRTIVREESLIERILKPMEVSESHPKMQKDKNSDTMYYLEDIEMGCTAMEVSVRGDQIPTFVNQKRYDIRFGKIESEELKKPQTELMVADNLISMIKMNNAEAVRRAQDIVGMRAINYAINATGSTIGTTDGEANTTIDWTSSVSKRDFSDFMNVIADKELIPAKFVMSNSTWNIIASTPFMEIGETSGKWFVDGIKEKKLLDLPVELTVKTKLGETVDAVETNYFKTVNQHGEYHHIYLFVDPAFMGKMIRLGPDYVWSKWEKDMFMWSNWRHIGIGFGNIAGMAKMTVKVK